MMQREMRWPWCLSASVGGFMEVLVVYGRGKGHWHTDRKIPIDSKPSVWSPLFPLLLRDLTQGEVTLESSR